MNNRLFFIYLLVLSGSTYLIRAVPFALVKDKINNRFIKSFLYYIPYAVLTAMTIPAIFYATDYMISAAVGLLIALLVAFREKSLTVVAMLAVLGVFIVELFI